MDRAATVELRPLTQTRSAWFLIMPLLPGVVIVEEPMYGNVPDQRARERLQKTTGGLSLHYKHRCIPVAVRDGRALRFPCAYGQRGGRGDRFDHCRSMGRSDWGMFW